MIPYQPDLLKTKEENDLAFKIYNEQLSLLPVNQLQEKLNIETPTLSEREFEIMHMVLTGVEIESISLKIHLTQAGIKWRLTQIYNKFGVENRLQLIEKSSVAGLQFFITRYDKETKENYVTKHTFHNKVNLAAHESDINGSK